jgi:hypothetical protein
MATVFVGFPAGRSELSTGDVRDRCPSEHLARRWSRAAGPLVPISNAEACEFGSQLAP